MAECLLVVKYLLVSCIFISVEFKEEVEDLYSSVMFVFICVFSIVRVKN